MIRTALVLLALLVSSFTGAFRLKAEATEVLDPRDVLDPPGGFRLQAEDSQEKPPAIDGRIGEQEWAGARREQLAGGGDVQLLPRGEFLFVAVRGPKTGLASLCVAKGKSVRILHASAAIGDATFERWGDVWMKRKDFEWALRDSPRTGAPTEQAKTDALWKTGWLANASVAGSPEREFQILAKDIESVGVTFLTTNEPMVVSYWPSTMNDDCRTAKIPQGYLPDTARFDPTSWQRLAGR